MAVLAVVGIGALALLRPDAGTGGPGGTGNPGTGSGSATPATGSASPGTQPGAGPEIALAPETAAPPIGPLWTGERTPSPDDDLEGTPGSLPLDPVPPEGGDVPPDEVTPTLAGDVSLGTAGAPTVTTIGPGGGTVTLPGLAIELRPGSLAADTPVTVTTTPIDGLAAPGDFGSAIDPVTPLYSIDLGDADLAIPATVTLDMAIPTNLPPDTVPMAFYRDPLTGTLSPLTPVASDDGRLTVLAPHFSDILGALVDLAKIPGTVDSGFRPGKDDWQFNNFGSYIATGGQCEGQTVSEIWYYGTQHKADGAGPLFGLYDNNGATDKTPTLWQDDSDGYRFVGSVHTAGLAERAAYLFIRDSQWDAADGRMTYAAFKVAIATTGRPQMLRISPAPGDAGHTLIVYRVTKDLLYLADPNYVGRLRAVSYDPATGKVGTYSSGDSATSIDAAGTVSFTRFAYLPWVASKTEAWVADRWAEFEAGQAGDRAYPLFDLKAVSGTDEAGKATWEPLADGFVTALDKLPIQITKLGDGAASSLLVFPGTSAKEVGTWGWHQTLDLVPGENRFGLLVYGKKGNDWGYVDFVRLTVIRGAATLAADPMDEVCPLTGKEYTYTATASGIPPGVKSVGFTWDFGAGPYPAESYTAPLAAKLTTQATNTFQTEGEGRLIVILNDTGGASPVEIARVEMGLKAYREQSFEWTLCTHVILP